MSNLNAALENFRKQQSQLTEQAASQPKVNEQLQYPLLITS